MLPIQSAEKQTKRFRAHSGKVHFISLGCPRNLVDTEVMLGIILRAGYEPTADLHKADYIVINTCGFLQSSRQESLDTIGQALHDRKKGAKVIATGCMVQSHKDQITEKYGNVDYFLGSGDVEKILEAISSEESGAHVSSARSYLESGEVPRLPSTPKHYAFLKIAEGCKKNCAYCIIPKIKGPLKSKPIERVVQEFRALRSRGVKEIILIAQDLGDWGKDLGYRHSDGLLQLLKELLKEEGEFWIRLLYLYPDEITSELIELMQTEKRICAYLDMPIQHINDTILKSMHRKTTKAHIIKTIETLREKIPMVSIRTSLIVGYPGESETQFNELCEFVKSHPLDQVGIFAYSKEEESYSATLDGHLPEEIKNTRQKELSSIQLATVEHWNTRFIGKTLKVIIEGYHPESNLLLRGRHEGQAPDIDGMVIINDFSGVQAFGEFYDVKITGVAGYDLIGSVIPKKQSNSHEKKRSLSLTSRSS